MTEHPSLTEREIEILKHVATGASNRQIAQLLGISANTVKVHLRNIFEKTGAASRTEATLYAIQAGMVEGVESGVVTAKRSWWQRSWVIAGGALVIALIAIAVGVLMSPSEPAPENVVDLEQLESERWQELAPMPTARKGLAVAAYDGLIYAIAGETREGVTDVVERYDPVTDTWETLPPKPTAVTDVGAVVIGGKIYVPGGRLESGTASSTLEIFDPVAGSWEKGSDLLEGLCSYAMAAFEGNLYLFGGHLNGRSIETVFSYNPINDIWQERQPLEERVAGAGAVTSSNGIFVLGGMNDSTDLSVNLYFQPDAGEGGEDSWTKRRPLPERRSQMGVGGIADVIFLLGGKGNKPDLQGLRYIPSADEWTAVETPFEQAWKHMGVAVLETRMFAIGGEENGMVIHRNTAYTMAYTVLIPFIR
jgi:DNA-binding CsgD family transcriptional regulator